MADLVELTIGMEISTPMVKEDRGSAWIKPRCEIKLRMEPGDNRRETAERAWNTVDEEIDLQIQKYLDQSIFANRG